MSSPVPPADAGRAEAPAVVPPPSALRPATPSPAAAAADRGEDRVLTAANAVTATRLASVPVFCWLLFGAGEQMAAAILLGVLGATDWVDGQLARRLHQVSSLGKVLDPAADRVLVGTAVVSVLVSGAVPLWFGLLTIAREVLVSGAVLVLAALGARRVDVLRVGKVGTFCLMVAYPGFLISHGTAGWQAPFHDVAWAAGTIGLVLAWAAAGAYVRPSRRALAEGRKGRGTRGSPAPTGSTTREVGA